MDHKLFRRRSSVELSTLDIINEYSLSIPSSKPSRLARIFPDGMLWFFVICVALKLVFFAYGVYIYENSLSRTINSFFNQWGDIWWNLEGLCDFNGDYIMFRENWLNGETLYGEAFNGRYLYPPLFYYIIHIFARWTIYSAPIVMFLCNITTGFFVFHLAKNFGANGRAAKSMMVLTLLSPFNLYYADFIWQNTGVFTTFVVISMWHLSRENYRQGMFWLGIAICIKQVAAFFLPVFLFGIIYKLYYKPKEKYMHRWSFVEYIKSIPWTMMFYYGAIPVFVFLLSSMPYILIIPEKYLGTILGFGSTNETWLTEIFSNIVSVDFVGTFVGWFPDLTLGDYPSYQPNYRTAMDVAFAWIGHNLGISTRITVIFSILFHNQIILFGVLGVIMISYWRLVKNRRYLSDQEFYWLMWYAGSLSCFGAILFYDVGIYKYYLVTLAPMWGMYNVLSPLNHDYWKKGWDVSLKEIWMHPSRIKYWFYGGGTVFHVLSQFGLQLLMLYFNKWLVPVYLYLPLFLLGLICLFIRSGTKYDQKSVLD